MYFIKNVQLKSLKNKEGIASLNLEPTSMQNKIKWKNAQEAEMPVNNFLESKIPLTLIKKRA